MQQMCLSRILERDQRLGCDCSEQKKRNVRKIDKSETARTRILDPPARVNAGPAARRPAA
jgi:hypothetical protein